MMTAVRSGGYVAVLENDAIHQLILPWPERLELAVREAELVHHAQSARQPEKRYIGRRLAATLREAGLVEIYRKTYVTERVAPLSADEQHFLTQHLARLREIASPHLTRADRREFDALTDPQSPQCMLRQGDFEMAWLDVLCCGKKTSLSSRHCDF